MADKYLFFVGKGKGTLVGVPARDLSYDEAKKYGITNLLASGLYVYNSQHAVPEEYQNLLDVILEEEKEEKPKRKYRNNKESE
jgi:hypothetical protein